MAREALLLDPENEEAWLCRRIKIGTLIEIHR